MGRREEPAWARGTVGMVAARERGDIDRKFKNNLMVTKAMIDRLSLDKELYAHMGCVNCLEWSQDGSILASASDDLHVILWDPFRYKLLQNIATGHTGNIFSVKFLSPETLATCAADGSVRVVGVCGGSLRECACHCSRVKRLATAPNNPNLLWSAAEDGLVLQHDMRAPHRCKAGTQNVLVDLLNHLGRHAEAKCVAVNPRRPHQLAVGANDFYVRLYDMRMIKLSKLHSQQQNANRSSTRTQLAWERQNLPPYYVAGRGDPENNIPKAAVQYYAPGHLSMEPDENTFPKKATTYVAFSDDGNELLVNLGSEQIYVFDLTAGRRPALVESFVIAHNRRRRDEGEAAAASDDVTAPDAPDGSPPHVPDLPEAARRLKHEANEMVNQGNYSSAVDLYSEAIIDCPDCAILYSNRAAALMRRGWVGDTYAAVRDCYRAIAYDPTHVKAHFRLAKALMDLKRAREAHECLLYFQDKFPRHATSHAVVLLQKDINLALKNMDTQADEGETAENPTTSPLERILRTSAVDYKERFLGHCNTTTDIKEANFLGPAAEFIAAGSDDGNMYIWSRAAGRIVRVLRGDESIVNCVQMHPAMCLLATSGIDPCVRLWSPGAEHKAEPRAVADSAAAAAANQLRMRSDPFEAMLLSIPFERDHVMPHAHVCRTT